MPKLQLGNLEAESIATLLREPPEKTENFPIILDGLMRVLAVMRYPAVRESLSRQQYLAVAGLARVGEFRRRHAENPFGPGVLFGPGIERGLGPGEATEHLLRLLVDPHGGIEAALDGPSISELNAKTENLVETYFRVGRLVVMLRTLALDHATQPGGASLSKALDVLVRTHDKKPKADRRGYNRATMMRVWKATKPIRHLCAALYQSFQDGEKYDSWANSPFGAKFGHFLARAVFYQKFLCSHVSHARSEPLNLIEDLWELPDWPTLPKIEPGSYKFSADEAAILKAYRAAVSR